MNGSEKFVVLGFDPGSRVIGWCILSDGEFVKSGSLSANSTEDFALRRTVMRIQLQALFTDLVRDDMPRISLVAIEDPMSRAFDVVKKLCIIKTMIEEIATWMCVEYVNIHPGTWQAEARKAMPDLKVLVPKELSLIGARRATRNSDLGQDEADAYWVAFAAHRKAIG